VIATGVRADGWREVCFAVGTDDASAESHVLASSCLAPVPD